MNFNYAAARDAGYTDQEIQAFLGTRPELKPINTPPPPPSYIDKPVQDLTVGEANDLMKSTGILPKSELQTPMTQEAQILPTPTQAMQPENFQDIMKKKLEQAAQEQADEKAIDDIVKNYGEGLPEDARIAIAKTRKALKDEGIDDPNTVAYALATIQHETAGTFKPVREGYYADAPGQEGATGRAEAIKRGYGGGENYYGRGYIQLTHRNNYQDVGNKIGVPDLADNPDKMLDPDISAKALAKFFKERGVSNYTQNDDFVGARMPVNGVDKAEMIAESARKWKSAIAPPLSPETQVRTMQYR